MDDYFDYDDGLVDDDVVRGLALAFLSLGVWDFDDFSAYLDTVYQVGFRAGVNCISSI